MEVRLANMGRPLALSSHIEPLWHLWISYGIDKPPTQDPLMQTNRSWASPKHIPNYTATRGAYKPYNTWVFTHVHTRPQLTACGHCVQEEANSRF